MFLGDCICYSSLYFSVCVLYFTVTMKKPSRTGPIGTVPEPPPDRHYNRLAMAHIPPLWENFLFSQQNLSLFLSPALSSGIPAFPCCALCHLTCSVPLGPAPSRCPLRQAAFPAQPEPTSAARCLSAGLCLPSSLLGLNEDERQGLVVTEAGGAGREAGSLRLQKAVLLFMFGNKGSGDI